MAHYARNTPPVRPPGRSLMPDQPWTAWWEIDDAQLQAPREHRATATDDTPAPTAADERARTTPVAHEASAAPESADHGTDPFEFPHVDVTSGGGLRRIGVSAAEADVTAASEADRTPPAQAPDLVQAAANLGLVETAATGAAAPAGVQTVYGRFSIEGVAQRRGDLVFTGVTFPDPVSTIPVAGAIELSIDQATNVAPDGVVVADMGGFTPGRQGFTLITTALGPGPVRVDGQYVVEI
jgi:hypothetical protein